MGYTLDQLREDVERKYGDFEIEISEGVTLALRSPLRLSSDERHDLDAMFNTYRKSRDDESDEDESEIAVVDTTVDMLRDQIRILARDKKVADRFLGSEFGSDIAFLSVLVEHYNEATQPGEASPS